jgi:UDP-N-acetylglucosamine:LPS N-acetylglucosamine transferase
MELIRSRRRDRNPAVVFIAGEGGHLEQAKRIRDMLAADVQEAVTSVLVTDVAISKDFGFDCILRVCNPSPKDRKPQLRDLTGYVVESFRALWRLHREHRVVTVIVTGPGFAAFPAIVLRQFGARLIVFESWSRFENRSKCSRVLYRFAHRFLIQHKELQVLYPEATWVGLL